MTGPRDRPSTQPLQKRKADQAGQTGGTPDTYRQERSALTLLYAAKIAAAHLHAPKHELAALIAAIKAEESAALNALRQRKEFDIERKRRKRFAWVFAARGVTRRNTVVISSHRPGRTRRRGRIAQPRR
jgi:hypothetical protein